MTPGRFTALMTEAIIAVIAGSAVVICFVVGLSAGISILITAGASP